MLSLLAASQLQAQGFIDDFNGASVNTNLWQVVLPAGDSSVTEGGGNVSLQNAGRLVTQSGFSTPYSIYGVFLMSANPFSNFKVMLRTDGVSNTNYPHTTVLGIEVQSNIEDDNGTLSNNLKIYSQMGSAGVELGVTSANLTLDAWHTFLITDDGSNISLFYDGSSTASLAVQSSDGVGNKIAFLTREGAGVGSSISANGITKIDSLQISPVPEPSSLAILAVGALGLLGIKNRKQI